MWDKQWHARWKRASEIKTFSLATCQPRDQAWTKLEPVMCERVHREFENVKKLFLCKPEPAVNRVREFSSSHIWWGHCLQIQKQLLLSYYSQFSPKCQHFIPNKMFSSSNWKINDASRAIQTLIIPPWTAMSHTGDYGIRSTLLTQKRATEG